MSWVTADMAEGVTTKEAGGGKGRRFFARLLHRKEVAKNVFLERDEFA